MTVAILVWSSMIKRRHAALLEMPASRPLDGGFLDFRYPWGNRVEIVGYDNIQFTKAPRTNSKYRSCELLAKTGPLLQWVFIGRLCSLNSPTAPP
jgi:hypothetical protein